MSIPLTEDTTESKKREKKTAVIFSRITAWREVRRYKMCSSSSRTATLKDFGAFFQVQVLHFYCAVFEIESQQRKEMHCSQESRVAVGAFIYNFFLEDTVKVISSHWLCVITFPIDDYCRPVKIVETKRATLSINTVRMNSEQ